eukprot:tig00000553_g2102.t1
MKAAARQRARGEWLDALRAGEAALGHAHEAERRALRADAAAAAARAAALRAQRRELSELRAARAAALACVPSHPPPSRPPRSRRPRPQAGGIGAAGGGGGGGGARGALRQQSEVLRSQLAQAEAARDAARDAARALLPQVEALRGARVVSGADVDSLGECVELLEAATGWRATALSASTARLEFRPPGFPAARHALEVECDPATGACKAALSAAVAEGGEDAPLLAAAAPALLAASGAAALAAACSTLAELPRALAEIGGRLAEGYAALAPLRELDAAGYDWRLAAAARCASPLQAARAAAALLLPPPPRSHN